MAIGTRRASAGEVADAVIGYADAFHSAVVDEHYVASPLGAWLVLALLGPAARGSVRTELAAVLGMDVEVAHAAASALLSDPHPAVAAAVALWSRTGTVAAGADLRQADLPACVARGPLPTRAQADAWAREHTLGLIESFPLDVGPTTLVVLCSALATRISWRLPFTIGPATDLGGAWAGRVSRVLVAPPGHEVGLVRCGDDLVGVHAARSADGLYVASVIADETVPRRRVLELAHRLGASGAAGRGWATVDPDVLPPGRTGVVTVIENPVGQGRYRAVMPAWRARTVTDLLRDEGFGFAAGAQALMDRTGAVGDPEAVQAAVARYDARGFEAAAVTVVATRLAAFVPTVPRRSAQIRFEHPYAVVAYATEATDAPAPGRGSPWRGLPVFSAWVGEPADAAEEGSDRKIK